MDEMLETGSLESNLKVSKDCESEIFLDGDDINIEMNTTEEDLKRDGETGVDVVESSIEMRESDESGSKLCIGDSGDTLEDASETSPAKENGIDGEIGVDIVEDSMEMRESDESGSKLCAGDSLEDASETSPAKENGIDGETSVDIVEDSIEMHESDESDRGKLCADVSGDTSEDAPETSPAKENGIDRPSSDKEDEDRPSSDKEDEDRPSSDKEDDDVLDLEGDSVSDEEDVLEIDVHYSRMEDSPTGEILLNANRSADKANGVCNVPVINMDESEDISDAGDINKAKIDECRDKSVQREENTGKVNEVESSNDKDAKATEKPLVTIEQPLKKMDDFFNEASERLETSFKNAQTGDNSLEISSEVEHKTNNAVENLMENDDDEETNKESSYVNDEGMEVDIEQSVTNGSHADSLEKQVIGTERGTFFIKRKKRRRKSKLWTPSKSRKLSSGYSPRRSSEAAVIVGTETEQNDSELQGEEYEVIEAEDGAEHEEKEAENDGIEAENGVNEAAKTETKDAGTTVEDKLVRATRNKFPLSDHDYFIGDEAILDEINQFPDAKCKKRKSLLFDKGKKTRFAHKKTLSDEEVNRYKEPFTQGWRREIVIRAVKDDDMTKLNKMQPCDVYYFPPSGNKIRSMVQISEWLANHDTTLTIANFSFMRHPIGIEDGEVVRHAAASRGRLSDVQKKKKSYKTSNDHYDDDMHDDNNATYDKPEIVIERDSDEFLMPLIAAAELTSATGTSFSISPVKSKLGRPRKQLAKSNKSPSKFQLKKEKTTIETIQPSNQQVIVSPVKKKYKATARKSTTQKTFKMSPSYSGAENLCSLRCPGLDGIPPMLYCNLCMCLFHAECVNYFGPDSEFECLRCKNMKEASVDEATTSGMTSEPMMMPTPVPYQVVQPSSSIPVTPTTLIEISRPTPHAIPAMSIIRVALPGSVPSIPLYKQLAFNNAGGLRAVSPQIIKFNHPSGISNSAMPISSTVYAMPNKPKSQFQEIRPAVPIGGDSVKQEPVDDSYDAATKGGQASVEMLGNLKNKLSSKKKMDQTDQETERNKELMKQLNSPMNVVRINSPSATTTVKNMPSSSVPSSYSAKIKTIQVSTTAINSLGALNRWSNVASNVASSLLPAPTASTSQQSASADSSAAAGSANAQYRLIPIGPPGPLPNLQFRQMQVPGTSLQGFVPVPNTRTPPTTVAASSPVLFGDLKKVPVMTIATESKSKATSTTSSAVASSAAIPTPKTDTSASGPTTLTVLAPSCINGQLLTLPPATVKKLSLNKPLSLKINNQQVTVPPSGFFHSGDGLKVFLPPATFTSAVTDLTYTVMEDKDSGVSESSGNLPKLPSLVNNSANSANKSNSNVIRIRDKNCADDGNEHARDDVKSQQKSVLCDKSVMTDAGSKCPDIEKVAKKFRGSYCFMQRLQGGTECMNRIFKYLNLKDLLRASMVCRTWRHVAQHPDMWQHVGFCDLKVSDWQLAMQFLNQRLVRSISLLGLVHYEHQNRTWHQLVSALHGPTTLRSITFGLVPASVLHSLCNRLASLEVFNAERISDSEDTKSCVPTKLDIGKFACLMSLKELRLEGVGGLTLPSFSFGGSLSELGLLKNLEVLHVVSVKNIPGDEFNFVSKLSKLRDLALGDCTNWTEETYTELGKLHFLKKLRLEQGGEVPDIGLGQALVNFPQLECLELLSFRICCTFGIYLSQLRNLNKIVIGPSNSYEAAEMNSNALSAVEKLTYLRKLEWIVPHSSSAAIILDDNENTECMDQGAQWIPFMSAGEQGDEHESEGSARRKQTEYIKVGQLKGKLMKLLPLTNVKVYSMNTKC